MNIKKELFYILQNAKDEYDLYEKLVAYIEKVVNDTKGKENAEFYRHIVYLLNSINNAGCERRREEQIEYLWNIESQIIKEYENYLP